MDCCYMCSNDSIMASVNTESSAMINTFCGIIGTQYTLYFCDLCTYDELMLDHSAYLSLSFYNTKLG